MVDRVSKPGSDRVLTYQMLGAMLRSATFHDRLSSYLYGYLRTRNHNDLRNY